MFFVLYTPLGLGRSITLRPAAQRPSSPAVHGATQERSVAYAQEGITSYQAQQLFDRRFGVCWPTVAAGRAVRVRSYPVSHHFHQAS